MPNDCWNNLTITGTSKEIDEFFATEVCDVPAWVFTIQRRGVEGIQLRMWSDDGRPHYEWLESLLVQYPSCWIKNVWHEEGGKAGVWIGSKQNGIRQFEWDDLCLEERAHRFRQSSTLPT